MLTPLDIHNKEFKRSLRGYDVDEVDSFLDEIIKDYEKLYKENLGLKEQVENFQDNIARYRDLEETLHNTMILAQQTSDEVKKSAEKEAQLIIKSAEQKAEEIVAKAKEKINDLKLERHELEKNAQQFRAQFRGFLLAQLELVEDGKKELHSAKNQESDITD